MGSNTTNVEKWEQAAHNTITRSAGAPIRIHLTLSLLTIMVIIIIISIIVIIISVKGIKWQCSWTKDLFRKIQLHSCGVVENSPPCSELDPDHQVHHQGCLAFLPPLLLLWTHYSPLPASAGKKWINSSGTELLAGSLQYVNGWSNQGPSGWAFLKNYTFLNQINENISKDLDCVLSAIFIPSIKFSHLVSWCQTSVSSKLAQLELLVESISALVILTIHQIKITLLPVGKKGVSNNSKHIYVG